VKGAKTRIPCANSVLAPFRVAFDGFHPDRADVIGATICLAGVGVIMYAR
jgi:drug/metabolite transporter superfamily protein YnfA